MTKALFLSILAAIGAAIFVVVYGARYARELSHDWWGVRRHRRGAAG